MFYVTYSKLVNALVGIEKDQRDKAHNKYNAKTYDRLNINVLKGERDRLKALAAVQGKSLNQYVVDAIEFASAIDRAKASNPLTFQTTVKRQVETMGNSQNAFIIKPGKEKEFFDRIKEAPSDRKFLKKCVESSNETSQLNRTFETT